jgi:hypothetical protein
MTEPRTVVVVAENEAAERAVAAIEHGQHVRERWRGYMDEVTGGRYSGCTCYEPGRTLHPGEPCPFHDEHGLER